MAAHQPWATYLAAHIAGPLKLSSMRVCDAADAPGLPATTVDRVQFVCANALDTARFVRALDRGRLVEVHTLAAMRARTRIDSMDLPYGWFTRIGDIDGHRAFGHTGNFPGVSVAAFTFPDDKLTIAVLTRESSPPAWVLLTQIAREALGLPAPALPHDAPPDSLVASTIGTYAAGDMTVRISARAGELYAQILEPAAAAWEGELVWLGGTSFAGGPHGTDPDAPVTFFISGDHAVAFTIGHRLMLDVVFRRLDARVPSDSDADGADVP
jgi:hypothetical protein